MIALYTLAKHFILQVYLDVFSVVVLVLGGALACYGKHIISSRCTACHNFVIDANSGYFQPKITLSLIFLYVSQ
jgi:hypothetical protein